MLQIMKNYFGRFYIIHNQLATKHQRELFASHFLMPTLIPSRVLSMASTSVSSTDSDKLESVLLNCDKSIRTIRELKQKIEHSAKIKRTTEESDADVWEQKFDYVNEKFVCCHNIWEAARLAVQKYASAKCGINVTIKPNTKLGTLIGMIASNDYNLRNAWKGIEAARSQIEEDLEIRNRILPMNDFVEIQEENCIDLSELEISGEVLKCGTLAVNEEAAERFSCDEQMKNPEVGELEEISRFMENMPEVEAECAQEYSEEEDLSFGEDDLDADVDPDQLEQYNKQLKEFVHGMEHLPPPAGLKHKNALIRFFMKASI